VTLPFGKAEGQLILGGDDAAVVRDGSQGGERQRVRHFGAIDFPVLFSFVEVQLVKRHFLVAVVGAAICFAADKATAQISWNGSVSTDPSVGANWAGGVAPGAGDVAAVGSSAQSPDFAGQTITWGRLQTNFANAFADTGGGGVLNLVGADDSQFFSNGDAHLSTIAFDIVATKNIQTNGTHSVTFNGDVTARKVEAFGGSVATFNGKVTQTDEFVTTGGGSKIVINNEFYWGNNGHGINNNPTIELGAGAKFFRPDGVGGWLPGLDVFNIYDNATVRLLADNALGTSGETDIWTRNTVNRFDMNGHDQFVEFFGMGDAPAQLIINFGAVSGANTLIWDAAAGLNGPGGFQVQNFEQGLDTLEFGQFGPNGGFTNPAVLARIRINGANYSATNPGTGPWWSTIPTPNPNDDPNRQIAVYNVPEPGSAALLALAAIGMAAIRRQSA
jgi:hypothetical protein